MLKGSILLVEDDELLARMIRTTLIEAAYEVTHVATGADAYEALAEKTFDILIEDMRLPDASGLDILRTAFARQQGLSALVISGSSTVTEAVEAVKLGAYDFLVKPFAIKDLLEKVRWIVEYNRQEEAAPFSARGVVPLVGNSRVLQIVLQRAVTVANTDTTVLVDGESGTGKELLAELIHQASKRKDKPIIKVNCAAIPENLLESELFGVEAGAFTGAHKTRPGYLEEAHGGTLFLDEIGELPLNLQVKLLRAIGEKSIYRVGGKSLRKVDFRLVTATNRNLKEMVRDGTFREDLFFRINVITLTLPPLRERREDIPLLINHFMKQFGRGNDGCTLKFAADAMNMLCAYNYPGNIRELRNIVEHLCALYADKCIKREHLHSCLQSTVPSGMFDHFPINKPLRDAVSDFETRYIRKVMQSLGGHKSKSADVLGISRKVLWEKLKRHEHG